MNSELKEYLLHEWKWNNHVKYLKYFEDWVGNLTKQQIQWYNTYKEGRKTLW